MKIIRDTIVQIDGTPDFVLKPHHEQLVVELYRRQSAVPAIRFIRAEYALGLKDAKDLCDTIAGPASSFQQY